MCVPTVVVIVSNFHISGEFEKPQAGSSVKRLPRPLPNRRRLWDGNYDYHDNYDSPDGNHNNDNFDYYGVKVKANEYNDYDDNDNNDNDYNDNNAFNVNDSNLSGEAFHFLSSEPGGEIQYDETCRSFEKKQKGPSRWNHPQWHVIINYVTDMRPRLVLAWRPSHQPWASLAESVKGNLHVYHRNDRLYILT